MYRIFHSGDSDGQAASRSPLLPTLRNYMETDSTNHHTKPVGDSAESGEINCDQVTIITAKGRLVSKMKKKLSEEAIQNDASGSKSTFKQLRESDDSVWAVTNSQAGLK